MNDEILMVNGIETSRLNYWAAYRHDPGVQEYIKFYPEQEEFTFPDGECYLVNELDDALELYLSKAAGDMSKW